MPRIRRALPALALAAVTSLVAALLAAVLATAVVATHAAPASAQTSDASPGYWLAASDGAIYQRGTSNLGDLTGVALARPIVGGAATSDGLGYWMVASDGGIFSFGDARFFGSTGGIPLARPIVGIAADPVTGGYWMVASDGGVFSFDAPFFGSTGNVRLNQPIVGMAPTPDGRGYWLVASDGGIFSFGDAAFFGSTGGITLARPVVGMAASPDGKGYWMVASDGGIFTFGDAGFFGSTGAVHLARPVVGMAASPDGRGYWLVASDGGIFTFGDAPFLGAANAPAGSAPIVAMLATADGYPFPPGATGYDISNYQCSDIPASHPPVAIVQVSYGAVNSTGPNPCYDAEAAWAGPNLSAYIFMNPLPSPAPVESLSGPAGTCNGRAVCEAFNFGYYWAVHWVDYSRAQGYAPPLWWLDVENDGGWTESAPSWPSNSNVIEGAVAGLRADGVTPGIYSTALQWGNITGNEPSFPGIALWVPGAATVASGSDSAEAFCTDPTADYQPFAGGQTVLVQYGYYTGNTSPYDQDFACL